ncbi:MAG: DNA polymerase III subunit delta [Phycisphaerae bacterium]
MAAPAPKPIYVLHGNDAFLRDRHRHELIQRFLPDADPQTCIALFDATAELSAVLDELRTLPFLAPLRMVIVHDADAFVTAHREALENYLESPAPSGVLVLIVGSWRSNTRLAKLVAKIGEVLDCGEVKSGAAGGHVMQFAAERDKQLNRDAAQLLVQWVGSDLSALSSEVEKLATYVGDRKQITLKDVSALVTASAGPDAFDLTNAIAAGNTAAALKALGGLLNIRGEEFRTLGLIGWHLRMALRAAELVNRGQSPENACRAAKVPPFRKKDYLFLLRRRPVEKLRADFRALLRADLAMKSGSKASSAMQDLVIALCN